MTLPGIASALDHLLASAPWAKEALRPHAGKRVVLVLPGLGLGLQIRPDGGVVPAAGELPDSEDLRVEVTPLILARLFSGDASAWDAFPARGDEAMAQAVRHVARHLRWDYEEDLSHRVGDIAAHRMGELFRSLNAAVREGVRRAGLAAAEYVTEEAGLSPPPAEIAAWCDDVARLAEATASLEARLARLESARG